MNLLKLSGAYLIHRKLHSFLSFCLVISGAMMTTTLILISKQLEQRISQTINGIDMVIGAKGSPMQIILSSIFHIDFPTGNISLDDAEYFSGHPLVKDAVAISLGDSYNNYRIVGVGENYFSFYDLAVDRGTLATEEMEAVIGASVAKTLKVQPGDEFFGAHGFSDGEDHHSSYRVAGVLTATNTVIDNLIFTPLESYWNVHQTEDETGRMVTSLLIRYKNPMAAMRLPRLVNATGNLQAAVPSFEAARLFAMTGIGVKFIRGLAIIFIGFAAFSIFISMYASVNERKYDLAVMRTLGASKIKLFLFTLLEGIIISAVGGIAGIICSHLAIEIFVNLSGSTENLLVTGQIFYGEEFYVLLICVASGISGALIPATMAYRTEISKVLAEG